MRQKYCVNFLLFATAMIFAPVCFAAAEDSEPASEQIGSEMCLSCHGDFDQPISETKHVLLFKGDLSEDGAHGCESCHGPGSLHMEDPENAPFQKFLPDADPMAKAEKCLACHSGGAAGFFRASTHAEEGLSCSDCHGIHKKAEKQLRAPQMELCAGCHEAKSLEISMPGRHPVKEGKVSCSSCHSPHASLELEYETGGSLGQRCSTCHPEKAGPFLYEHEPAAETCLACHQTHGSANNHLLQFNQPSLCLQCHADAYQFHNVNLTVNRKCTGCHAAQHGSNLNPNLLR